MNFRILVVLMSLCSSLMPAAHAQDRYCAREPLYVAMDRKTTFVFELKEKVALDSWSAPVFDNGRVSCYLTYREGAAEQQWLGPREIPAGKLKMRARGILQSSPSQVEFERADSPDGTGEMITCGLSWRNRQEAERAGVPKAFEKMPLGSFLRELRGFVKMKPGLAPEDECQAPASVNAPAAQSDDEINKDVEFWSGIDEALGKSMSPAPKMPSQ